MVKDLWFDGDGAFTRTKRKHMSSLRGALLLTKQENCVSKADEVGEVVKLDAVFAQSEFIPSSGTHKCHLPRTRKYLETNMIEFARLQSIRSAWCQVPQ